MGSDDQPTCGKGLAANAVLPAKLAELMAERADVLERHIKALDLADPNARTESAAYAALARAHRDVAGQLDSLARQMAGCRDLPMARHDQAVMADPNGQMAAFRRFVAIERELVGLLETKLEGEERLLR
ncbi:MAG TPA: hypothetical protein VG370_28250 [Chloroflexota bacterium]|jgi:hypothetical protein|nr:hypothetical protein [Chloroflexota bacterium]